MTKVAQKETLLKAAETAVLALLVAYLAAYYFIFYATEGQKISFMRLAARLAPTTSVFSVYTLPISILMAGKAIIAASMALSLLLWHFSAKRPNRGLGLTFLALGAYGLKGMFPWPSALLFYFLLLLLLLACTKCAVMPAFSNWRSARTACALAAILLLALFLRGWNLTGYNGLRNNYVEGQILYTAGKIAEGLVPYRDFIYTHPPLVSYITAVVFKFFGAGLWQARAVNLLLGAITTIPLYLVAKKVAGPKAAILAALIWAIHPNAVESGRLVVRETAMAFFMLSGIAVMFYKRTSTWRFLSGLLLGLAVLSKEVAILAVLPVLLAYGIKGRKLLPILLGLGIALAPMAYFYAIANENMLFAIKFHANTIPLTMQDKLSLFYESVFNENLLLLLLALIGAIKVAQEKGLHSRFLLAWAIYTSGILLHRTYTWHYGSQFLPFIAIFLAIGIKDVMDIKIPANKLYTAAGILLALLVILNNLSATINEKNDDAQKVADALARATGRGDAVLSPMLQVPFFAERNVPGAMQEFGYQNRLLTSEDAIRQLEKHNVSAVVMDKRITKQEFGNTLGGFVEYVKSNYGKSGEIKTENDNISIWAR